MARRRSKPFETHIVSKTVKLKNKKKKGCFKKKTIQYCWWYDDTEDVCFCGDGQTHGLKAINEPIEMIALILYK